MQLTTQENKIGPRTLSLKERFDNARMNDLARRLIPPPKPVSFEATHEKQLVAVADRKLATDAISLEAHILLVRRARRQHTMLHEAVIHGDLEGVRRLVTDENIDLATVNGLTPLHLAAYACGQVQKSNRWDRILRSGEKCVEEQILNHLIEAGAPVDVLDDMKRLPAACLFGARIPPMLAHTMEAKRQRTARIDPTTADSNDKPTVYNCFFEESDNERVGLRGGSGNKTGRGGNKLGITKIKGEYRAAFDDRDEG